MIFTEAVIPLLYSLLVMFEAYRTGILLEVTCFFFIPLQLIFMAVHWSKAGKPVLYSLLGSFIIHF